MPGTVPISGHNGIALIEANDGDGAVSAAGTFVLVASVTAEFIHSQTRAIKKASPKGATAPTYLFSPEMEYDAISLKGNFLYANASHDEDAGLQAHWEHNTLFGLLLKGPEWSAGVDEIIVTGALIKFARIYGIGADEYGFEAEFQPTGIVKREGDLIGIVESAG